jgi:hypothetical protein
LSRFGRHTIQACKVGIEHNFMTAKQKNRSLNALPGKYVSH